MTLEPAVGEEETRGVRNSEDEPQMISLKQITNHFQSQLQLIQRGLPICNVCC